MTAPRSPGFVLPPQPMNPLRDRLEDYCIDFARSFGLVTSDVAIRRLRSFQFDKYVSLTFPTVDFPDLCLAAEWWVWATMIDDQFDEGPLGRQPEMEHKIMRGLLAQLVESPTAPKPNNPVTAALADMWPRTVKSMPEGWRRQFLRNVTHWVEAYCAEAINRARGTVLDLSNFVDLRIGAAIVYPFMDLVERVERLTLPDLLYDIGLLDTVRRPAAQVITGINDVAYGNDVKQHEKNTYITIIARDRGCTRKEAIEHVYGMLLEREQAVLDAESQLPERIAALGYPADVADTAVRAAVSTRSFMRATIDWTFQTGRYDGTWCRDPLNRDYLEDIFAAGNKFDWSAAGVTPTSDPAIKKG